MIRVTPGKYAVITTHKNGELLDSEHDSLDAAHVAFDRLEKRKFGNYIYIYLGWESGERYLILSRQIKRRRRVRL
jgi:hypothetical protein